MDGFLWDMREKLLKGTTISDFHPDWKCDICDGEGVIIDRGKKYCEQHWSQELGFRKIND